MRYHEMWRQLLIKIERNSLLQLCNISNFNKNDIIFHLQQFFLFDIEIKCWKTILGSSPTNEHASLKLMHFKSEKLQSKLWISFSKLFTYVIQIKILDVPASFELIEKIDLIGKFQQSILVLEFFLVRWNLLVVIMVEVITQLILSFFLRFP